MESHDLETTLNELIAGLQEDAKRIRACVTCSICHELMFQPFLIAECSHSFCYSCLCDWLNHHKSCPTCRTKVKIRPVINYGLRDIVEPVYAASLLANADERSMLAQQYTEANAKAERDHLHGPYFPALFRDETRRTTRLVDMDDGVMRCAQCNWEVEEGDTCAQCGYEFSDVESYVASESEEEESEDMDELDPDVLHEMDDFIEDDEGTAVHMFGPDVIPIASDEDPPDDPPEYSSEHALSTDSELESGEGDDEDDRDAPDLSFVDARGTSDIDDGTDPEASPLVSSEEAEYSSQPFRKRQRTSPAHITLDDSDPPHLASLSPPKASTSRRRTVIVSSDEE